MPSRIGSAARAGGTSRQAQHQQAAVASFRKSSAQRACPASSNLRSVDTLTHALSGALLARALTPAHRRPMTSPAGAGSVRRFRSGKRSRSASSPPRCPTPTRAAVRFRHRLSARPPRRHPFDHPVAALVAAARQRLRADVRPSAGVASLQLAMRCRFGHSHRRRPDHAVRHDDLRAAVRPARRTGFDLHHRSGDQRHPGRSALRCRPCSAFPHAGGRRLLLLPLWVGVSLTGRERGDRRGPRLRRRDRAPVWRVEAAPDRRRPSTGPCWSTTGPLSRRAPEHAPQRTHDRDRTTTSSAASWRSVRPVDQAQWQVRPKFGTRGRPLVARRVGAARIRVLPLVCDVPGRRSRRPHGDEPASGFRDLRFEMPGRAAPPFRYGMCRLQSDAGDWRPYTLDRRRVDAGRCDDPRYGDICGLSLSPSCKACSAR
jgi:hypothetical protein